MSKIRLAPIAKSLQRVMKKHGAEILTGLGIAGMITGTILAVKDTPKALELIEEKKNEEDLEELTPVETIKTVWKCYIPAALTIASGAACIIGGNTMNRRRLIALTAAYSLSESTLKEYKDKVLEHVGEKEERVIHEAINQERLVKNPYKREEVIFTRYGNKLFFDSYSGRYFESDKNYLERVQNFLNDRLNSHKPVSLNDFYEEIGLEDIKIGDYVGWDRSSTGLIDLRFDSKLLDDGTPCAVLDHFTDPVYDFDSYLC